MKKIKFAVLMLTLLMSGNTWSNDFVDGLWVSPAPGADFDESTVWYTVKNYKSGGTYFYLSTASGYTDNGYVLKLSNTAKDNTDAGLWCVTPGASGGYQFYNKALGTGYVLSTANGSMASMVKTTSASSTVFTFTSGTNSAGISGWFIKDGLSGNNYWNQQNGYLGHWNSGSAKGDNNSTFIFELKGDAPPVPVPEIFSENEETATFHGIKFKNGSVYISEGKGLGELLVTKNVFDTSWAFIGTADSFKLMSMSGNYVDVKRTSTSSSNVFCYTVADASSATDFVLLVNDDGTYEIARKGISGTTFNPWGGMAAGKNIGFWNAGDANNRLVFADGKDMKILDYKVINGGQRPADISPLSLWYDFPSTLSESSHPWMEYGLPIGNGQIGATLMGGVLHDEMILNEKTLYNGSPTDYGEHGTYMCMGSIVVDDLGGTGSVKDSNHPISDYVRYLDIEKGIGGVNFTSQNGTRYTRRYITSAPHKVLAAHYQAEGADKLHLRFTFRPDASINATSVVYEDACATFDGKLKCVDYSTTFRVVTNDGTVTTKNDCIEVEGATEVTLYMAAGTNFDDSTPSCVSGTRNDVASRNQALLQKAMGDGWETVLADHVAQFTSLMSRVDLQLGNASSTMQTDKLLDYYATASNRTKSDGLFLEQLYFQYGRYLAISCNNLHINVPANLQGIWNDDSNTGFWHCDIHADVNVQMNYWPVEVTNLSSMHLPFLNNIITLSGDDYNYHRLAQRYKKGVRGWMVATENNIFGGTSTWMAFQIKTMAAWNCSHLWQHYRYTLDRDFLKRALPTMLRAAQFLKDISTKATDGTWFVADEYSPEHGPSGHSTAFAQQNTSEVVRSVIEGAEILGSDSPIAEADLQEMKDFYAVLDKGLHTETYGGNTCLKEWADLTLNSQGDASNHRHLSHLMALFPYGQVSAFSSDPQEKQLYKAAVNSLHVRNSTDVTGWSASWKINLHARALEGDAAHRIFPQMLKHSGSYQIVMSGQGGCYYNLWDSHSPFQIDGNFGYTSGVAEMLLQSYDGQIHLLPALPSVWKNGHVKGLKAVGDFTVDQEWADGAFAGATITNNQGQPLSFTVGSLPEGKTVEATVNDVATGIQRNDDGSFAIPSSSAGDVVRINVIDKALVGIRQPHAYAPSSTTYNLSGIPVNDSFQGLVIHDHKVVLRR